MDHDSGLFRGYRGLPGTFDELIDGEGQPRQHVEDVVRVLGDLSPEEFSRCQDLAELSLFTQGVTFSVYADARGTEKIFPICLLPRVIDAKEWLRTELGLVQRLSALSMFLDDIYDGAKVVKDGIVPEDMVFGSTTFNPKLRGIRPPGGVRIHIAGVDLIRGPTGEFCVLEDNVRTPSGVSYVLENRGVSKRVFHKALSRAGVQPVESYPSQLGETLQAVSPVQGTDSTMVVLTPGSFNSAYFEHTFLARQMGIPLVESSDLFVENDVVFMRTTHGPRRVDVIYRRIDDDYLDPKFFRDDSLIGVPGLMKAYAAGQVALANAPGNGVADDKAIYPFVPDMIRYYLSEEPILSQVDTFVCARPADRAYVTENLDKLVVKSVDEAGGYGMLMGPSASAAERAEFKEKIKATPRKFIAQHRIELSTCPTWDAGERKVVPRRVDLRPFILTRPKDTWVLGGGLTRVALRKGSYVVNSSQGGGAKDTWVRRTES
jgi:uncharacterized circularly permuted ATP-grasp superfamily protein